MVKRKFVWRRQDSVQQGSRGISACGLGKVWLTRPWRKECGLGTPFQQINNRPGNNMATGQAHWRGGVRDLLLQDGAGEDTVVPALPTKVDLDGQLLLLGVPHTWHLPLLHGLLDLQQSRKSDTASVHSHGQWGLHGETRRQNNSSKTCL